jgi:hypothetical protein
MLKIKELIMFKVAGVSRFKGQVKVRFANDTTRVKLLVKAGNTDIELIELASEMSKADATRALKDSALYATPEYAEAIDAAIEKYNPTVKVKGSKVKSKPSMEDLKARAQEAAEA